MHCVIETPEFLSNAKDAGVTDDEIRKIVTAIAKDPTQGDEIKGTGGARKVRFPGRGKGKSGGYRVITFYSGTDIPIFLISMFAKGDKVDLSQANRNALRKVLSRVAENYRQGVRTYVEGRR